MDSKIAELMTIFYQTINLERCADSYVKFLGCAIERKQKRPKIVRLESVFQDIQPT